MDIIKRAHAFCVGVSVKSSPYSHEAEGGGGADGGCIECTPEVALAT